MINDLICPSCLVHVIEHSTRLNGQAEHREGRGLGFERNHEILILSEKFGYSCNKTRMTCIKVLDDLGGFGFDFDCIRYMVYYFVSFS